MNIYFRNHDLGLTLNGLLLLHKPAGIQSSSFEVRLVTDVTAKITYRIRCGTTFFKIDDTREEYKEDQLLSLLGLTLVEFRNRAYAFVDGEARSFNHIEEDLMTRADKAIVNALMQIDGVLTVIFSGWEIIALRDPKRPKPSLTPLQRAMVRDGKVIFEDVKGKYKDDFKGDKIMPQNTNPLTQSNPDPVIAETGTLGHFCQLPTYGERR
jgi:hypothetical protein